MSLTNILVFGSYSQLSFNTQTAFPIANWQQRAHQHLNKRLVSASVRQVCMPRLAKVSCQGFSKRISLGNSFKKKNSFLVKESKALI